MHTLLRWISSRLSCLACLYAASPKMGKDRPKKIRCRPFSFDSTVNRSINPTRKGRHHKIRKPRSFLVHVSTSMFFRYLTDPQQSSLDFISKNTNSHGKKRCETSSLGEASTQENSQFSFLGSVNLKACPSKRANSHLGRLLYYNLIEQFYHGGIRILFAGMLNYRRRKYEQEINLPPRARQ